MSKNSQASISAPPASRRDTIFGHVFLLASHLLCMVLPLLHAQHLFHDKRKTTFWFSLHCYLQVRVFMDALTCAIKFTTPSIWKELSKDIMSHLAPCSLKPHTFKVLTNFLSACAFFTRLDFVVYANSSTENQSILTCMGTKSIIMVEFFRCKAADKRKRFCRALWCWYNVSEKSRSDRTHITQTQGFIWKVKSSY